ncbi:MAG: hypothetical protein M1554_02210 [Patescibacteria group bacterium]|jgi:hypothetical protein|nr:hypothetical protein [Patescibacteria group bacterium]
MAKLSKKAKHKIKSVPKAKKESFSSKSTPKLTNGQARKYLPKERRTKINKDRKLTPGYKILYFSSKILLKDWFVLLRIILIYIILYIILVLGLSLPQGVSSLSSNIPNIFHGTLGNLQKNINILGLLFSSSTSSTSSGYSGFSSILFILLSLVAIWSIRNIYNDKKFGAKDAYYNAVYPAVPFILILALIGIDFVPSALGLSLYSYLVLGGIAINTFEKSISILIVAFLVLVSFYFFGSSIFALMISTLEGVTPMKALRSARELVRGIRWKLILKLLFLFVGLFIGVALIMLVDLFILPVIAQYLLDILLIVALFVAYSYIYYLYRELINE